MVRKLLTVAGLVAALGVLGTTNTASAMTSVEGTVIGDQGFYWDTPAEVWIFPHRMGNIDNRVMLQWAGAPSSPLSRLYNVDGYANSTGVIDSIQKGPGGGFVLELVENLNLGMWISTHSPGHGGFVSRGIAATGWNNYVDGAPIGELQTFDAYNASLEAGRKIDLFVSYWFPELDIETGLHLWWGSASAGRLPDDSVGPIDLNLDSNIATDYDPTNHGIGVDAQSDKLKIDESTYGLNDLGFGLGAGWRGIEGFRADLGFNVNLLGVSWEPNALDSYADIGGAGFGLNLRSHFDLSDEWTVGGFIRFVSASMSLTPQRQRDGGTLEEPYIPSDTDLLSSLPNPSSALPNEFTNPDYAGNEAFPVNGTMYEESNSQIQIAGLVRYTPMSRAKLYGAVGFRRNSVTAKTSVGSIWYAEENTAWTTLPFFHIGAEGKIFDWLDMFIGASKQWRGETQTSTYFDSRIPDNTNPPGPAGTLVTPGQEDNQNTLRREFTDESSLNNATTSTTSLMLGARVHHKAFQLMAHVDPNWVLAGPNFLSGQANNMFAWIAIIYDWDYDFDAKYGNGTQDYIVPSPHDAAPAVAPAAPVHLPPRDAEPKTETYEEFDG